jgi:hypothetical protein
VARVISTLRDERFDQEIIFVTFVGFRAPPCFPTNFQQSFYPAISRINPHYAAKFQSSAINCLAMIQLQQAIHKIVENGNDISGEDSELPLNEDS